MNEEIEARNKVLQELGFKLEVRKGTRILVGEHARRLASLHGLSAVVRPEHEPRREAE